MIEDRRFIWWGNFVTGGSASDELFLAVVYGLLILAPLAHEDGAVRSSLHHAEIALGHTPV